MFLRDKSPKGSTKAKSTKRSTKALFSRLSTCFTDANIGNFSQMVWVCTNGNKNEVLTEEDNKMVYDVKI